MQDTPLPKDVVKLFRAQYQGLVLKVHVQSTSRLLILLYEFCMTNEMLCS
jgi:hypothetical protein